jgi:hypothetical protein
MLQTFLKVLPEAQGRGQDAGVVFESQWRFLKKEFTPHLSCQS